jgi:hypothetical protein
MDPVPERVLAAARERAARGLRLGQGVPRE